MKLESPHGWYMRQREKGWHKWFAWRPVEINSSTDMWLQIVERRITGMIDSSRIDTATWEYRELTTH